MIAHQNPGVDPPAVAGPDLPETEKERPPVVIRFEHGITAVAPGHHVVSRPGVLKAQRSWHIPDYPDHPSSASQNVSALDLTPFAVIDRRGLRRFNPLGPAPNQKSKINNRHSSIATEAS
jgi:hypothetical protein